MGLDLTIYLHKKGEPLIKGEGDEREPNGIRLASDCGWEIGDMPHFEMTSNSCDDTPKVLSVDEVDDIYQYWRDLHAENHQAHVNDWNLLKDLERQRAETKSPEIHDRISEEIKSLEQDFKDYFLEDDCCDENYWHLECWKIAREVLDEQREYDFKTNKSTNDYELMYTVG